MINLIFKNKLLQHFIKIITTNKKVWPVVAKSCELRPMGMLLAANYTKFNFK